MIRHLLVLSCALIAVNNLSAAPSLNGLEAVTLSPDGKTLAAGGHNRVVYLLDPDSLKVTKRLWLGARIVALTFNKDGSRLVVEDDAERVHLLDGKSGKAVKTLASSAGLVPCVAANIAAVRDTASLVKQRLRFVSLIDGKETGEVELRQRPAAWAFDKAGKQLVILTASEQGEEKRVPLDEVPKDLTGLARLTYRQKNDGLVSTLRTFSVPRGVELKSRTLWYTSDSDTTRLVVVGPVVYVFNRVNECARIAADGTTTMFQTPRNFNHALAIAPDGKTLLTGGLRDGSNGDLEGKKHTAFALPALPGQDEFVAAFAFGKGGVAYGVTSAFRVFRLDKSAKVTKVAAVY